MRPADAGGRGSVSTRRSAATTSAPSSSSPRQASCTRGSRRGRSRPASRPSPAARRRPTPPAADAVVWACGAWLPKLFPELVDQRISRRDVFFFGVDARLGRRRPASANTTAPYYGHGELGGLGMKISPDGPGREVDPDRVERLPDPEREALARAYAARRFPALAGAPIVGARVCQYDLTPDTHFLVARHPERPTGGSSAAARATGSSTARRSRSTSPTASRVGASRSRSTGSARAAATRGCAGREHRGLSRG